MYLRIVTTYQKIKGGKYGLAVHVGPFSSRVLLRLWRKKYSRMAGKIIMYQVGKVDPTCDLFPAESEPEEVYRKVWDKIVRIFLPKK